MKQIKIVVLLCFFLQIIQAQNSEELKKLSLQDVIKMATDSSLNAFVAQNTYYAGYWTYHNYRVQKLPFLNFSTNPLNYSRQVNQQYSFLDSSYHYVDEQTLSSMANLSLNQIITKTGGKLYIDSDLGYLNNLNRSAGEQFSATPIRIGYNQQLFGFNPYKWKDQIEPLKFEKAKKQLIESMERISLTAINYFFDLARARVNLEIAVNNLANADTLYSIGLKRLQIASITQEDLFTLKLDLINSKNNFESARTNVKRAGMNLYSLLRLDNTIDIELILPEKLPDIRIEPMHCLELARENNPDILEFLQQSLEGERNLEQARKNSRFTANVNASFGLNQQGGELSKAYYKPLDQEIIRLGLSIPLIDWGLSKGEYQLAKKNMDVLNASIQQAEIDFDQTVLLTVEEFNLQKTMVLGAAEADTIASQAYEITKKRFMMGNADLLKLSSNRSSSIAAKRSYINALENYWDYYYTIRRLALYDFENNQSLLKNLDDIIGN